MSVIWAPWATRTLVLTGTPRFTGSAKKLTLHSMECGDEDTCCWPTYGYGGSTPHFSACPLTQWRQHIPMDRSARTLRSPGTPRSPNINAGVNIQIEVCGRASHIEKYGDGWYQAFSERVAQICEWWGIPKVFPFEFGYSSTAYRKDWPTFQNASGIVAHQNAPFNDHWDAPFNQAKMLQFMGVTPTPTPPPTPPPTPAPSPVIPPDWMGPWPYPADHYFGPPPANGYSQSYRVHNGMTDPVAYGHVQNVRRTLRWRGWNLVAPSGYYNGPRPPQSPCAFGFSEEICKFQRAVMKTSGDGYLGPKTWEAIRKTPVT